MNDDPTPEEFRGVTPQLVVADAEAAIGLYAEVFGADVFRRASGPDGRIWHVEVLIRGGRMMLLEPYPEMGMTAPDPAAGTSVVLHVFVPDVDAQFARAVQRGCEPLMEPADTFWGDRYAQVRDPFGHRWSIASRREDLSEEEIGERAAAYVAEHPEAPEPP